MLLALQPDVLCSLHVVEQESLVDTLKPAAVCSTAHLSYFLQPALPEAVLGAGMQQWQSAAAHIA